MSCNSNPKSFTRQFTSRLANSILRKLKPNHNTTPQQTLESLEPRLLMAADVIISEIMYHPPQLNPISNAEAERTDLEWIEITNRGDETARLSHWEIDRGIDFTFPNISLAPGQFLVIASDITAFLNEYPGVTNVTGNWSGKLSNSSEEIRIQDENGDTVDRVTYADEGDWSRKIAGNLDFGTRGWEWSNAHDGDGFTLELNNLNLSNNHAHNWSASNILGGTPGAPNSTNTTDIAPMIQDVTQFPIIPSSSDPVTISTEIVDELNTDLNITLFYRIDGNPSFTQLTMRDNGLNGDTTLNDGRYSAQIPATPDGSIIEYYIRARDINNNTRFQPNSDFRTTRFDDDIRATMLYQVDNSFNPNFTAGETPFFRLITNSAEKAEFDETNRDSNAQYNATFISHDGTELKIRHNVDFRVRGAGSRGLNAPPLKVNFISDQTWEGVDNINLNANFPLLHAIGMSFFHLSGLATTNAQVVTMTINGVNEAAASPEAGGFYAWVEQPDQDFVDRAFPDDKEGNAYQKRRPDNNWAYHNGDIEDYLDDGWEKENNNAENDWSDLDNFLFTMNNAFGEDYYDQISQVVNVEQWLRWFAVNSFLNTQETNLSNGTDDDYDIFFDEDGRAQLIAHDQDSILGQGGAFGGDINESIFTAIDPSTPNVGFGNAHPQLVPFFSDPTIVNQYYEILTELANTVFSPDNFAQTLDLVLQNTGSPQLINEINDFMDARRAAILAQIPTQTSITANLPTSNGYLFTSTPTVAFEGNVPLPNTKSAFVNNQPLDFDPLTGEFQIGQPTFSVETILPRNSTWDYLDQINYAFDNPNANEPYPLDSSGRQWFEPDFNIATSTPSIGQWESGPGILGAGGLDVGPVATQLDGIRSFFQGGNFINTYLFRSTFEIENPNVTTMNVNLLSDDGGILYINGVEVLRHLMNQGPVDTGTNAIDGGSEEQYLDFQINVAGLLNEGTNHIAYELHQVNFFSSDIGFDLALQVLTAEEGSGIQMTPGINRVFLQTFDGENGTGNIISESFVDVWYDSGTQTVIPPGEISNVLSQNLEITAPSSYVSGVPFTVTVKATSGDNNDINRQLWDALATLTSNNPEVTLDVNSINILNGVGTAQVIATGPPPSSGEPEEVLLIEPSSQWKYLDDGSDQGTAWTQPDYNDSNWAQGNAELGYGDGDEETIISFGNNPDNKHITYYFRKDFNIADTSNISTIGFDVVRDDGVAVYLNGVEIFRDNLSENATYQTPAITFIGGNAEGTPVSARIDLSTLPPNTLREGRNVIAVEIHQNDGSSSDLSFNLQFGAIISPPSSDFTIQAQLDNGLQNTTNTIIALDPASTTTMSGTLSENDLTWSGHISIAGDITVPQGATLNILPGTQIAIQAGTFSSNAANITIEGSINATGTADAPISFLSSVPENSWGRIIHTATSTNNTYSYVNILNAGDSPTAGQDDLTHAILANNTDLTLNNVTLNNISGAGIIANNTDLSITDTIILHTALGIESNDSNLNFSNSSIIQATDGIIINNTTNTFTNQLDNIQIALTENDGILATNANLNINNSIFRNNINNALSLNSSTTTLNHSLFIDNNTAIELNNTLDNTPQTIINNITLAQNDSGIVRLNNNPATNTVDIDNAILRGPNLINTGSSPALFTIDHSNIEDGFSGTNNIDQDPLFTDPANNLFTLQENSPAIDAGDPLAPLDPDNTTTDQGALFFNQSTVNQNNITWTAENSPYRVTGDLIIPEDATLTIEPGTTVFFDPGAGLTVHGLLHAQGTPTQHIRMAVTPGQSGDWDGINFDNSTQDNVLSFVDMDSGDAQGESILVSHSKLLIDHMTWSNVSQTLIEVDHPQLIVQHSILPSVNAEYIHGEGFESGDYLILESNLFQFSTSGDDVVDILGPRRPGSVLEVRNNIFLGGADDGIDLDGNDAHIEGNIFVNFSLDTARPTTSNAIATGEPQTGEPNSTELVAVRNIFINNDHGILLKEDSFLQAEYNIFLNNNTADDNSSAAIVFNEPGGTAVSGPGRGAFLEGNAFWNNAQLFSLMQDVTDPAQITVINNILDDALFNFPAGASASGNISEDPRITIQNSGIELAPGSPLFSFSNVPQWLNSAMIKGGASVIADVPSLTHKDTVNLTIAGPGLTSVAWKLDDGPWSADIPLLDPLTQNANGQSRLLNLQLDSLSDGMHTVYVRGIDSADKLRAADEIDSFTWMIDSNLSQLLINEVLASNTSAFDNDGTNPDAIELFNHSASPRDISGFYITDNPGNPTKFEIPTGTIIPADGYLTLIADDENTPGIHTGFALSAEGEGVYLFDPNGSTLLDFIEFGLQIEDHSIGRVGPDMTWALNQPTIGAPNIHQQTGDVNNLTINEWLANGQIYFNDDFVEIHNADTLPVDISNIILTDNLAADPEKHQLPNLSFISANGFIDFDADDNNDNNARHLSFNLNSNQGQIHLLDANHDILDQIVYFAQKTDTSQGRIIEGSEIFDYFAYPTPGITNVQESIIDFIILSNFVRITEVHYNPEGSDDKEFIELKNIGTAPVNLQGLRLDDAVSFTFPDYTLAPGQFALVVRDQAGFEDHYGDTLPVVGEYDGGLDNNSEQILLRLPTPNQPAISRFTYNDNWVPQSDSGGYSIVIADENQPLTQWDNKSGWRSSYAIGGSPAQNDVREFTHPRVTRADWNDSFTASNIHLEFSEFVAHTITPQNITILNTTTNQPIAPADFSLNYDSRFHHLDITFPNFTMNRPDAGSYILSLSQDVNDLSGNEIESEPPNQDYTFNFNVDPITMPAVSVTQANHQSITLQFTKDVSASLTTSHITIENDTKNITLTPADINLTYNADNSVQLTFPNLPGSLLPSGEYNISISTDVTDNEGMQLIPNEHEQIIAIKGDTNFDEAINLIDLIPLANNFGRNGSWQNGDFSNDNMVDNRDLAALASNFGQKTTDFYAQPINLLQTASTSPTQLNNTSDDSHLPDNPSDNTSHIEEALGLTPTTSTDKPAAVDNWLHITSILQPR